VIKGITQKSNKVTCKAHYVNRDRYPGISAGSTGGLLGPTHRPTAALNWRVHATFIPIKSIRASESQISWGQERRTASWSAFGDSSTLTRISERDSVPS
jgi:hypothetical protein